MTKTANDIARTALRDIGVLGIGQDMAADDFAYASEKLTLLYAELTEPPRSLPIAWTIAAVPDSVATALAQALAVDIGRPYGKVFVRQQREEAMSRLLTLVTPDDRTANDPEDVRRRAAFY